VDLSAIRRCALMAIEGEKDDITGLGQTRAALDLTPNLPASQKAYHLQMGAGHYGIFNGSRFRAEIVPEITAFMTAQAETASAAPAIKLASSEPLMAHPEPEIATALIAHEALASSVAATELHA
jgi:hypothetical protein